jgi:N-acetylmuramoyl-L-alanine amidase
MRQASIFTLLMLCFTSAWAASTQVKGMRLWSGPESTRFVLDLSGPIEHRLFTLAAPDRIVIDLAAASLTEQALPEARGLVAAVRSARREGGELRVVLDLAGPAKPQSFLLQPNETYGHRLVVDLKPPDGPRVVKRAHAPQPKLRDLVIAIDPGHGGEDPGATGRRGIREKDVVLAISRKLAREIDYEPGMKPILVRDGDYFVPLRNRMERAREQRADLFVSIHADAFRNSQARGATVYVLSPKGASDEASRRLAERENASDLIGGVSLADKDQILAQVLLDLSQNAALNASASAGERVIQSLGDVTRVRKTQVQRAPFLVLKSPDIPSILIETAYISNPSEEAALSNADHQSKLARAIHDGVKQFFYASPPPDTRVAALRQNPSIPTRHVIARGDTLSEIADRYDVNLGVLKSATKIRGDRIVIGQVLTLPRS